MFRRRGACSHALNETRVLGKFTLDVHHPYLRKVKEAREGFFVAIVFVKR